MSVHCDKGSWYCRYSIIDETGTRRRKKEYFGSGPDARFKAQARDEELRSGGTINKYERNPVSGYAPTFDDLASMYLRSRANDMPKTSIENLLHKLKKIILPEIGLLEYQQINHNRLDQYVTKRLRTPVTRRSGTDGCKIKKMMNPDGSIRMISKTTVHRELCDILAILNWSVHRNIIPKNYAKGYRKPKRDDRIIRPPGPDEAAQIIRHAAPHLQRALLINYYTGLRPGNAELNRLAWSDVDWENQTILIRSAKKGGISRRAVAIHPDLLAKLKIWQAEDKDSKLDLIIHYKNSPVASLKTAFAAAKRRAGITRRIRPYDFRHAAITQMILKGDLKAASEIAGHTDVQMTIRQYEHITTDIKRLTVNTIDSLDV